MHNNDYGWCHIWSMLCRWSFSMSSWLRFSCSLCSQLFSTYFWNGFEGSFICLCWDQNQHRAIRQHALNILNWIHGRFRRKNLHSRHNPVLLINFPSLRKTEVTRLLEHPHPIDKTPYIGWSTWVYLPQASRRHLACHLPLRWQISHWKRHDYEWPHQYIPSVRSIQSFIYTRGIRYS